MTIRVVTPLGGRTSKGGHRLREDENERGGEEWERRKDKRLVLRWSVFMNTFRSLIVSIVFVELNCLANHNRLMGFPN